MSINVWISLFYERGCVWAYMCEYDCVCVNVNMKICQCVNLSIRTDPPEFSNLPLDTCKDILCACALCVDITSNECEYVWIKICQIYLLICHCVSIDIVKINTDPREVWAPQAAGRWWFPSVAAAWSHALYSLSSPAALKQSIHKKKKKCVLCAVCICGCSVFVCSLTISSTKKNIYWSNQMS